MSNSDYLLKAAIKKVAEKLGEVLIEKIEEATNIAQDAPEIIKKEFDTLKDSIIEEAARMENQEKTNDYASKDTHQNANIKNALEEIEEIDKEIEQLNKKISNQIS